MTWLRAVEHRFVEFVPRVLDPGVLYISLEYTTVAHLCCCGCGKRVILPLSPAQWEITFDGETISLWPSVGNWDLGCRSHYVIERNQVRWSKQWSPEQVAAGRRDDTSALNGQLEHKSGASSTGRSPVGARLLDWLLQVGERLLRR